MAFKVGGRLFSSRALVGAMVHDRSGRVEAAGSEEGRTDGVKQRDTDVCRFIF